MPNSSKNITSNAFAFDQVMASNNWDPLVEEVVTKVCVEYNYSATALHRLDNVASELIRIKHRLKSRMVGEPVQLEEIKLD